LDSGRRWPRHPRPIDFVHCYLFAFLPSSFPAGPPAPCLLSICGMPSRAVEDFPSCPIPPSLRASAPLRTSFHRLRRKTLLPYTTVTTGFRAPAHLLSPSTNGGRLLLPEQPGPLHVVIPGPTTASPLPSAPSTPRTTSLPGRMPPNRNPEPNRTCISSYSLAGNISHIPSVIYRYRDGLPHGPRHANFKKKLPQYIPRVLRTSRRQPGEIRAVTPPLDALIPNRPGFSS